MMSIRESERTAWWLRLSLLGALLLGVQHASGIEIVAKQSEAYYLAVPMLDEDSPKDFKSGLTVTDTCYYKTGAGAWATQAIADSFAEVDSTGVYEITIASGEISTHDQMFCKIEASGAPDSYVLFRFYPNDVDDCATPGEVDTEADEALANYDGPTDTEMDNAFAALNDLSAAEVDSECDEALANYDPPTDTEMDNAFAGLNDLSAAEVDTECDEALANYDPPTDTEMDNAFAGLNDLSDTEVWAAGTRGLTEAVAADVTSISGDSGAADNLETMLDGTGGEALSLSRLVIAPSGNDTGVNITASGTGAAVQITSSATGPAVKVDSAAASYPVFDLNATGGNNVFDMDVTGGSGNAIMIDSLAGSTAVSIYGGTHGVGIYGVNKGMTIQSINDGHGLELISEGAGNHALALQQSETDQPAIAWAGATVLQIEGDLTGSVDSVTEPVDLVDAPNATAVTAIQSGLSTHDAAAVVSAMFEYAPDGLSFESLMEAIQAVQVGLSTRDGRTITHYRNDGVTPKVTGTIRGDRTRMSVEIAD